jgi:hypothetical protein
MISRNLNQVTATSKRVLDLNRTGVVASSVPGVGTSGPAYLYNDVVSLGLVTEDVCGEILSTNLPFGWVAYSDGSLYVPTGMADGAYYVIYKVKVNGVPQSGTGMASIWVGPIPQSGPSRNLNVTTITGRRVLDTSKTGVIANSVPASGLDGPGYIYNDLVAAGLVGQEVSGEVIATNLPGAWYAYSDTRLYIPPTTPDGDYYLRYKLKINGVPDTKLSTVNIHLGAAPAVTPMNRNMNQSFSGKRLLTTPKVGVLASLIPSTGTHGPAYAYNDLTFPADANKLVRGFILTLPSSGTMLADDDTSFTFSGAADGVYTFTYELRVDDVVLGTATGSITVGTLAGISIVLDPVIVNMSASSAAATSDATIAITLDNGSFSISANSGTSATISILLDNVINSVSATAGNQSSFDIVLDTVVASMSATSSVTSSASFNIILSNILTSVNAVSMPDSPEATIDIQLSNGSLYMTASGSEPPLSVGPNVQIPITLAVDIYGKLIIVF